MEMKREVAMNIKANADSQPVRVNVVFDMSGLTMDQIADWATSANGMRVWFQNKERPKGHAHLVELSKKTQTVKVPPCGTRLASTLSTDQMLAIILRSKFAKDEAGELEYNEWIEGYESTEEALTAKLMADVNM
jgi:hypothetical protein